MGGKKKMKTLCGKFRKQLSELYSSLTAANPQYIRCIKPNGQKKPDIFDTAMSLRQMKYAGLFEAVRIRKSGFPFRGDYETFAARYRICLAKDKMMKAKGMTDHKAASEFIVDELGDQLDKNDLAFGKTKIFMRNSQRVQLGLIREGALINHVLTLQAFGRMIGARQLYKKMKALKKKCDDAMSARDTEKMNQCLADADEQKLQLFVLKSVTKLINYLETEARIAKLLADSCEGGDSADISVISAVLDEVKKIDDENPEEKHTEEFEAASKKANDCMKRLIALDKAKKDLDESSLKESIPLLEKALADCKGLGITGDNITNAEKLLERLKYADQVMQDLHDAVEKGDVDAIQKNLELTSGFALDDKRQLDVAKAKEVMKGKYDEMVTAAVDAKDLPRLEELMPKLTALGASYGDLATKGNNGIKKCYIAFCEECVESKNHEKLEKELIPKIKNELKFDDLELKANQCLEEIYKLYIDEATEAKDIAKLDELIVKVNELSLESAVFYGNEKLRATFDILSREAETKNDPNLLEGDNGLIAQIKNHNKFDAQLDIAIDCLK